MAGGGTATRDRYVNPISASYYMGGKGNKTTESNYSGTAYDGRSEGGGLLVVYANSINIGETAKFASAGKTVNGSCWAYTSGSGNGPYHSGGSGGGSGGGSINIFYKDEITGLNSSKFEVITGSYSPRGTYNVGTLKDGTYKNILTIE